MAKFIGERYGKSLSRAPIPVMRWISSLKRCGKLARSQEIGPCSNLALAVLKAPDIVPLIKGDLARLVFKPGNVTPTAEFNWWFDPEAAHIVVRTPFREQLWLGSTSGENALHL